MENCFIRVFSQHLLYVKINKKCIKHKFINLKLFSFINRNVYDEIRWSGGKSSSKYSNNVFAAFVLKLFLHKLLIYFIFKNKRIQLLTACQKL